jgi:hypothetical protein
LTSDRTAQYCTSLFVLNEQVSAALPAAGCVHDFFFLIIIQPEKETGATPMLSFSGG